MKKVYFMIFGVMLFVCGCHVNQSIENKTTYLKQNEYESIEGEEVIEKKEKDQEAANKKEAVKVEMTLEEKIDTYISEMSIEEKIGQLFMIAIRKDEEGSPITYLDEETTKKIKDYNVGGIVLFSENIQSKEQVKKLIIDLQEISKIPLFIGVDEEGGSVSRVGANTTLNDKPFLSAYSLGRTEDTKYVYEEARRMGKLLKALGFNMDFAPVADIFNEPSNTVIGKRSFGTNQEVVTPMVLAFAKGLKDEGIQPVVKHFPGHGNTKEDSHESVAYIDKSLGALEIEELIPFEKAIEADIGGIMKGHLLVPAVDEKVIVSLSSRWDAYMKQHYNLSNTLIMTDAMEMGAVIQNYGQAEAAYLSILAGNDIILMPSNLSKAYEGVYKAYEEGRITEERINESLRKILSKKVAHNILVLA